MFLVGDNVYVQVGNEVIEGKIVSCKPVTDWSGFLGLLPTTKIKYLVKTSGGLLKIHDKEDFFHG